MFFEKTNIKFVLNLLINLKESVKLRI